MSLIVIKDKGYQEYKTMLAETPEVIEQEQKKSRKKKVISLKKRMAFRVLGLGGISLITASIFVGGFTLWSSGGDVLNLELVRDNIASAFNGPSQAYAIPTRPVIISTYEEVVSGDKVWKCNNQMYTNSPNQSGQCEYIWNSGAGSTDRYFTPNQPEDS